MNNTGRVFFLRQKSRLRFSVFFHVPSCVCLTESMMITIAHGCSSTKHWRFWNVLIQPQVISVTCSPVRWAAEVKSESCLRMANASWLCNCRSPEIFPGNRTLMCHLTVVKNTRQLISTTGLKVAPVNHSLKVTAGRNSLRAKQAPARPDLSHFWKDGKYEMLTDLSIHLQLGNGGYLPSGNNL